MHFELGCAFMTQQQFDRCNSVQFKHLIRIKFVHLQLQQARVAETVAPLKRATHLHLCDITINQFWSNRKYNYLKQWRSLGKTFLFDLCINILIEEIKNYLHSSFSFSRTSEIQYRLFLILYWKCNRNRLWLSFCIL